MKNDVSTIQRNCKSASNRSIQCATKRMNITTNHREWQLHDVATVVNRMFCHVLHSNSSMGGGGRGSP